jgi:hypothetical protein
MNHQIYFISILTPKSIHRPSAGFFSFTRVKILSLGFSKLIFGPQTRPPTPEIEYNPMRIFPMINLHEESIEAHSCYRHTTNNNKTIMHPSYPGNSPFIPTTDFNCKDNLNSVHIPKNTYWCYGGYHRCEYRPKKIQNQADFMSEHTQHVS